ncbi:LytTR family DNA-binding domain-containing protein [uncultured Kriegella sp.]|uniref:LytR/AlgR family response regulator transcription factor n=1 Tax=uncultured Kriegella sp. TaxID=1798910 RepID=UPI0030D9DBC6|tara:strand:+ start:89368 stop:90078 length:711 start_codon:yes stop_codon:yes gene_type:complete
MTCIIVDDEKAARAIVARFSSKVSDIEVVAQFDNAIDAIKFLNQSTVDVVFLDIHMPGFSGVDFVRTLKDSPKVVLITSDTNFAIESYEYESIVDYLVKPINFERFEKSIRKIKSALVTPAKKEGGEHEGFGAEDYFYINIDRRLIKLKFEEVLLIKVNGDYIDILTEKQQYHVHTTLKNIKQKLPEKSFLQIHRSYIINFTKIIDIEDNSVLIEKNVVPISRNSRPELMRRLNLL